MSPALAGRFSTTAPPGKSWITVIFNHEWWSCFFLYRDDHIIFLICLGSIQLGHDVLYFVPLAGFDLLVSVQDILSMVSVTQACHFFPSCVILV